MSVRWLDSAHPDFTLQLDELLAWDLSSARAAGGDVDQIVRKVISDVQTQGDAALLLLTEKFDSLVAATVSELEISQDEMRAAFERIDVEKRVALERAAQRIHDYHQHQVQSSWSFTDEFGNQLGQRVQPLERVGVYVPGGQASYPSSVLMTLIPAKVAGVEELIVTVPAPSGIRNDMVLAALFVAGADRAFTIGGAQAVAALAYGTETIPKVDKIVGPGGAFVAAAKRLVFGQVGIDLIAGPSEICVVADHTANAEWIVWDLFSQAEHDADAQAILVSADEAMLGQVDELVTRLLPQLARREIAAASLAARGALIKVADVDEALRVVNRIAPEHLELHIEDAETRMEAVKHAGAIFCGRHSGETFGDYVAGPSHVLPTFGTARFASPLGVYDFQKRSSVIQLTAEGAANLADIAVPLATSEGLEAHARAASLRAAQTQSDK